MPLNTRSGGYRGAGPPNETLWGALGLSGGGSAPWSPLQSLGHAFRWFWESGAPQGNSPRGLRPLEPPPKLPWARIPGERSRRICPLEFLRMLRELSAREPSRAVQQILRKRHLSSRKRTEILRRVLGHAMCQDVLDSATHVAASTVFGGT